ncbi:nitronate monooxygenase [Bacteriovorax stolpii]|uniref:Nitronate monooxygenase n=1 Tax=Bacteriovorax stolpii TaxID=960 RepID=A0A2K9NS05_BACTC|nr:nitronate monooxygenase [Bacteriovorax stolpii]AUN98306.1 nitronate monooxygenase [Bacteriovorax stolpii]TDP52231.1 enoyl-[acyl-carrier protein] reductase II [Bacteriovorax stolpii]
MKNRITDLFGIQYPIIQGGMVWVSGAKLAASVSNAGGLGLIGAGSMKPDLLKEHILKVQGLTQKPFGVNVPLLYEKAQEQIDCALDLGVKIFFTSAGSPKKFTSYLKQKGAIVVHVTSSPELALKCAEAGVDGIVAEGFEAGGHNGREEITTMTLIPQVREKISLPLMAAGGIASGSSIAAAMALGADGVQMGTRFLMTRESSAHENFKKLALEALPHSTQIMMRKTVPVRLLQNQFSLEIKTIEETFTGEELKNKLNEHLGKYRAKMGMLDGDLAAGELEIGQIVSLIKDVPSVEEVMKELISDYQKTLSRLPLKLD